MLFFQSVIVYSLFAFSLYAVSRIRISTVNKVRYHHWYSLPFEYWVCIFIFAFFSGIRYDVGVDYISYLSNYIDALNGYSFVRERGIEEGYYAITMFCSQLGVHPIIYFGLLSAVQLYFLLLVMRDEKGAIPYMLATLILGNAYLMWMNGIRQLVAASIFVFAATKIPSGKWKSFLLLLLIAFTWHHSVVILLPLYLLRYDKLIWDKKMINLIILFACLIIGNIPTWIGIMIRLGSFFEFIGYDYYAENLSSLTDIDKMSSYNFGPRKLTLLACNLFVVVLYPRVRTLIADKSKIDLFFKLSFIGMCLYYLFDNTLVFFRRPVEYFTIFLLPMVGYTLYYLKINNTRKIFYYIMLVSSCSFLLLQCYIESTKPEYERQSTLYQTYWCDNNFYQYRIK